MFLGCKDVFKDNDSNFVCVVGCKFFDVILLFELNYEVNDVILLF